jgi:hypothetical protein
MNYKCVVCYKPADVIFDGTTYCKEHFENIWTYATGKKKVGDEKNWGKSLYELKNTNEA